MHIIPMTEMGKGLWEEWLVLRFERVSPALLIRLPLRASTFPPGEGLRTGAVAGPYDLIIEGDCHGRKRPRNDRETYFTIRLTSLFLTTIVLTILPPFFSRKVLIFWSANTLATTVSLSRSASITTVPRILPLT